MKREHPLPKIFKIRSQSSGLDILPIITHFPNSVAGNFSNPVAGIFISHSVADISFSVFFF